MDIPQKVILYTPWWLRGKMSDWTGDGDTPQTVMTTRAPAVLKKPPMGHFTNTDTFDAEVWIESSDTNSMLRHCQSGGSLT